MRTNLLSFVLSSERRTSIVRKIFEYPKRLWSCSGIEELTKIPHSTTFRTLSGLKAFGVLKSTRINKKDLIYELVNSPLTKELKRSINIHKETARSIAKIFTNKTRSKKILSILLYGSTIKASLKPESDIDILIIIAKHNPGEEKKILDIAAELSSKFNKAISTLVLDLKEFRKEKNNQFLKSVKENKEVLYGKDPF